MFDVLTYQKGASVLRMLERYLGRRTLSATASARYLEPTSTPTPRPPTCGTPSRRPAASRSAHIMDTWILQGGYPLVTWPTRPATAATWP